MLGLVMFAVPESIEYLIEKRPKGALDQYNRIADRLGYSRAGVLPAALESPQMRVVWKSLFSGVTRYRTVCLWLGYAGLIAAFYFANTWTAKMIADASGDPSLGVRTGVLIMVGGMLRTASARSSRSTRRSTATHIQTGWETCTRSAYFPFARRTGAGSIPRASTHISILRGATSSIAV
jgi:hypothetical protein